MHFSSQLSPQYSEAIKRLTSPRGGFFRLYRFYLSRVETSDFVALDKVCFVLVGNLSGYEPRRRCVRNAYGIGAAASGRFCRLFVLILAEKAFRSILGMRAAGGCACAQKAPAVPTGHRPQNAPHFSARLLSAVAHCDGLCLRARSRGVSALPPLVRLARLCPPVSAFRRAFRRKQACIGGHSLPRQSCTERFPPAPPFSAAPAPLRGGFRAAALAGRGAKGRVSRAPPKQ